MSLILDNASIFRVMQLQCVAAWSLPLQPSARLQVPFTNELVRLLNLFSFCYVGALYHGPWFSTFCILDVHMYNLGSKCFYNSRSVSLNKWFLKINKWMFESLYILLDLHLLRIQCWSIFGGSLNNLIMSLEKLK